MSERRTVSVNLEVKAAGARKDIKGLKDDAAGLDKAARGAGRGLDEMGDKARKTGRETEAGARKTRVAKIEAEAYKSALGSLDRQIDATVIHLKVLGREFESTGNKATLGAITAERAMLKRLQQIKKDVTPSPGPSSLGALASGIGSVVSSAPLVAAVVAAAVVAAPALGAIIGGAVTGAVGAGGVVGGIVAATHDGRVSDAFKAMGGHLKDSFFESGRPFLGPLLHETAQLQATAGSAIGILRKGFADLAPVLHPLVLGLDGFVEALGPGLGDAFKVAKPLLRAFANELPRIGAAISHALSDIAGGSDGALEGMIALSRVVEGLIRGTGAFIHAMEVTYAWLVRNAHAAADFGLTLVDLFPAFTPLAGKLHDIKDQTQGYMDAANAAKDSSNDFAYSLDGTADSADAAAKKVEDAAKKVEDYKKALEDLFRIQMTLDEANIRYQKAIDDTLKILKDGKKTLDINTQAGRDNKQAILDEIQAIEDLRKAHIDNGMSVEEANKQAHDQIELLRITAERIGFDKKRVDELTGAYETIASKVAAPKLETPGLAIAQARLNKIEDTLDRLDGRVVRSTYLVQEQHREDARLSRRWGGVTEHAASGLLRQASVYSAASPARYAFAEPATGGEAFVPRRGEYGRSMSILSQAARWYGASVVPAMGSVRAGGTTTVVHEHRHTLVVEGTGVMSGLRREIGLLGGDVQASLGSRLRVGG